MLAGAGMELGILFIRDFAVIMIIASIAMLIFHRFNQPAILGYILTGFLLSPHTPAIGGFLGLNNPASMESMSEMAIVFLMFSLGLDFSIRKFRDVGKSACLAAGIALVIMFMVGCTLGRFLGWSLINCLFLGTILCAGSTMMITKTLSELKLLQERFAGIIIGLAIIEDIVSISMMAILTSIAMTGGIAMDEITGTLFKLGLFFALALIVGLLFLPRLMDYVERSDNQELMLITSLGLCFGTALLAQKLGYSTALGAFIIGALIAETHINHKVKKIIIPLKDMFSAVFFVIVGTMIDPQSIFENWYYILLLTGVVLIGRSISYILGAIATGNSFSTSMKVGLCTCNMGEMCFIVLTLGKTLGVLNDKIYPIGTTTAILTMIMTPFIIRKSDYIISATTRIIPKSIMQTIGIYINWYQKQGLNKRDITSQLARRFSIQNLFNIAIITTIVILTAVLNHTILGMFSKTQVWSISSLGISVSREFLLSNFIWLMGLVGCVPFLMIINQNHSALALLISEERIPAHYASSRDQVKRVIYFAGICIITTYVVGLIASLLPLDLWYTIYILAGIAILIGYLFRHRFELVYQKAEVEIESILARKASTQNDENLPEKNVSVLLNDTRLFPIPENAPCVDKHLKEIDLRNKTGATIISIERNNSMIISPSGEEHIYAGDNLLLLGNTDQLDKAQQLLTGEGVAAFVI